MAKLTREEINQDFHDWLVKDCKIWGKNWTNSQEIEDRVERSINVLYKAFVAGGLAAIKSIEKEAGEALKNTEK